MALDLFQTYDRLGNRTLIQIDGSPVFNPSPSTQTIDGVPDKVKSRWSEVEDDGGLPEDGATRRQVFTQTTIPASDFNAGDIWIDSDDNNHMYVANDALQFVSVRDGTIATAAGTANWSEVVNDDTNKPDDNATLGATFNSNIAGGGTDNTQCGNDGLVTLFRQTIFGNGADGAQTFNGGGTSTLTTDLNATSITISNNTTLATGGYRIFCSGTISIESGSKITGNGNDGGNGGNGIQNLAGGAAGTAGAATSGYISSVAGKAGKIGGYADAGVAGENGASPSAAIGGNGSAGGAGGAGDQTAGGASSGGTGSSAGIDLKNAIDSISLFDPTNASLINSAGGAGSGGSGSGGSNYSAGGGSGGSGASGTPILICAKVLTNAGTIESKGGAGGDGGDGDSLSNNAGGGGGGAGGNGGVAVLIYQDVTLGSTDVTAGVGGTGGTGEGGSSGNGANGTAGSVGSVLQINI